MTTYNTTYNQSGHSRNAETVNTVSPLTWLRAGWGDIAGAPMISALVGGSFTALCAIAYTLANLNPMFSASILVLLLVVSPFFAVAAYSVARQREQNRTPSLRVCFDDVRSRALSIGLFSILYALIVSAWVRFSSIVFALYYGTLGPSSADLARAWTTGSDAPTMLLFLSAAGVVLALTLFITGAFALPLIADRNLNVISAVQSSVDILRSNITSSLAWVLLLIVLISAALLSGLVLMPVVFPLLAYATWHSYRQLARK